MPSVDDLAQELVASRKGYEEAREQSRAAMLESVEAYNRLLSRMLSDKVDEVEADGVRIRVATANGMSHLDVEDADHPEPSRPAFGGIITQHDRRGE